jgi:16S rRNA (cytidine1402-2'-O)-methyltransferase
MPGTLYVVATPIGNLEDVTLRALRILREVSVIAAEDTRRTSRLLQHYSISTPTTSLHAHNEDARTPGLIARLRGGESVALVSDAGTPIVSDPGTRLVAAAHAAGVRVEPVPGPCAAVAAISAAGVGGEGFLFVGFPPARAAARAAWLGELASERRPIVMYEAPHRIRATLQDMLEAFGDRTVALGRELTKSHEELVIKPISAHLAQIADGRGEYTLVVSPAVEIESHPETPSAETLYIEFGQLTDIDTLSRKGAIKQLALKYGLSARTVYSLIEKARMSGV